MISICRELPPPGIVAPLQSTTLPAAGAHRKASGLAAVSAAEISTNPTGSVSRTRTLTAGSVPLLVTVIVQVTGVLVETVVSGI